MLHAKGRGRARQRAAALGVAAALALSACAGPGAPQPPGEAAPAPPVPTSAPAALAPVLEAEAPGPAVAPGPPSPESLLRVVSPLDRLPAGYVPPDLVTLGPELTAPGYAGLSLRREAAAALADLVRAADAEDLSLRAVSGYRSFEQQAAIHQRLVERRGAERARRVSASPGHSEHQHGTAVDISGASVEWRLAERLAAAPEGAWLASHAHEFGFALSYPAGGEAVTGYVFEPWHYRYIGRDHAARWHAAGVPLVTYLRGAGR